MEQRSFINLISGRSKGHGASMARLVLRLLSFVYLAAVEARNFFYSAGIFRTRAVDRVVISVGNITVGGTGKTPLVIWLCKFLRSKGLKTAVLTRGYRPRHARQSQPGALPDEVEIIARASPETSIVVQPDRFKAAQRASRELNADVLIMDDGFQHRRLARDLDIVTIDATNPFGFGRLLPAGLLREPISSLKRADACVITRADKLGDDQMKQVSEKISAINPELVLAAAVHKPTCVEIISGEKNRRLLPEQLNNYRVFCFCGLANAGDFIRTVKDSSREFAGSICYNDHYQYIQSDVENILKQAVSAGSGLVVCTEKDAVKLKALDLPRQPVFGYLKIQLEFIRGQQRITQLIEKHLGDKISSL